MKFQYSPGLIGYGAQGADGSNGLQGMSIYFTDYDPIFNINAIEFAIENDYVLWSTVAPGTSLPIGKTYVTGDVFISERGNVYEIDAENNTFLLTPGLLSKSDYFTTKYEVTNDFTRYFNDISTGYIIDNVNMHTPVNYVVDKNIYGLELRNFTRIEYCDVSVNFRYPFTVYSIGENKYVDDAKSISIVYDASIKSFRIGNIDILDGILPVSLVIDASLVKYNRPQIFDNNTQSGTVLTNNEKTAIYLYSDEFNSNPVTGLNCTSGGAGTLIFTWDISSFTGYITSFVTADIYFYEQHVPGNVYNFNNSAVMSPMVFSNVDTFGTLTINGLPSAIYGFHMVLKQNGWERSSDVSTKSI